MAEYDASGNLKAPPIAEWPDGATHWAMWWALNPSGCTTYYTGTPKIKNFGFVGNLQRQKQESCSNKYNITNWQQSLTSREEAVAAGEKYTNG